MKFQFLTALLVAVLVATSLSSEERNSELSFYTGTFDVIDKEGDDKTTLFGIEHKNPDLFRDTFLGKFKPITGGFITGDLSLIHI